MTKELIEEATRWAYGHPNRRVSDLIHHLVGELEAAEAKLAEVGEVNKYAGFLARQNHQRDPWRGIGAKCLCGRIFDLDVNHAMHQVEEILAVAAVTPQREVDEAALAEVIFNHDYGHNPDAWEASALDGNDDRRRAFSVARAVAAWLKDGGRNG